LLNKMDYEQKFEPKGNKVLHGAGQSLKRFYEYWEAVEKNKPVIYMTYIKIQNMDKWVEKIKKEVYNERCRYRKAKEKEEYERVT